MTKDIMLETRKGFARRKLLDQGSKLLRCIQKDHLMERNTYIYAANSCFWGKKYLLNYTSLQFMSKNIPYEVALKAPHVMPLSLLFI